MNVLYKNGKLLIEIDKNIGNIEDILENIRMRELFYKSNKLDEENISEFADEINKSYYNNFLKNLLKERGIIENNN